MNIYCKTLTDCYDAKAQTGDFDGNRWQTLEEELNRGCAALDVKLPPLKADGNRDVLEVLSPPGVRPLFLEEADFSRLSNTSLLVGLVKQAVSFSIDEKGAEAAAATVVGDLTSSGETGSAKSTGFHVLLPFLCVLSEKNMAYILFMGKMEKM